MADTDGTVTEYNAADGKKIRQLRPKGGGSALAMTLSANQKLLALGLDQDRAVVYDMETGEKLSTMSGHVRYIYALQFTPDGKRLATLSRDGTAKLWDVESGRELVTLFRLINGEVPLAIHFGKKGRHISVATSNRRIVTTDVFPWNLSAYGNSTASLEMRVEAWKRHDRLNPHMTFDATEMAD